MKSYKALLLARVEIRCAMWAANLITDEVLEVHIDNVNHVAKILETGKPLSLTFPNLQFQRTISYPRAKQLIFEMEASNKRLIQRWLK